MVTSSKIGEVKKKLPKLDVNAAQGQDITKPTPAQQYPLATGQTTKIQSNNGAYSAEKGGYVDASGQLYPTTNPNFKPNQLPQVLPNAGYKTPEEYKKFGEYDAAVQQEAQQRQIQQETSQLGLTEQQILQAQAQATEAPINIGQAATAGFANVLPSTIGGAVGGAAVGLLGGPAAPVTSTVGAIIGGAGGFLTGLFNGIKSNIKSQQSGEIASSKKTLSAAKTTMRQLATLASKDPANAAEYVQLYNQQLANVYTAQAKLKRETSGNLNSFMNDGTQDLAEFDLFLQSGGMADIYQQRLAMALVSGASLDFTAEDLAMYEAE